jgi:DNA processing protein
MNDQDKNILWLRLARTRGLGPVLTRRLYEHFQGIDALFAAGEKEFCSVEGVRQNSARDLKNPAHLEFAEAELKRCEKEHIEIIPFDSPSYPKNLAQIPDPPPLLYVKGRLAAQDEASVAVIGSRNHNEYGEVMAKRIGSGLARFGITVVSGMARGIDSLSQQAALEAKGRTVAVLGTGVDVIYPPEMKPLYERIIENGAVVSEFQLGEGPSRENFPTRNRIISGLAMAVVLVQATNPKSGALITVNLALEQGRMVYAVPGNAGTVWARETNRLIRNGAALAEGAEDVILDLFPQLLAKKENAGPLFETGKRSGDLTGVDEKLYSLIPEPAEGAIELDHLIRKSGLEAGRVQSLLIEMELFGVIEKIAGGKWRKKTLVQ